MVRVISRMFRKRSPGDSTWRDETMAMTLTLSGSVSDLTGGGKHQRGGLGIELFQAEQPTPLLR